MPGGSDSDPDVYSRDCDEELGELPAQEDLLGCRGIDTGSLGIGSFGWLVEDSVMQVCCSLQCVCILNE